jgi:hypothetical protein
MNGYKSVEVEAKETSIPQHRHHSFSPCRRNDAGRRSDFRDLSA